MVTVVNSVGSRFRLFSKVRETSAIPEGERVLDPLKIRSSRLSERRDFILCSPITHRMASTIFDFPHPLGPTMPVIGLSRIIWVLSAKDLKPLISNDLSLTDFYIIILGQCYKICLKDAKSTKRRGYYISAVQKLKQVVG